MDMSSFVQRTCVKTQDISPISHRVFLSFPCDVSKVQTQTGGGVSVPEELPLDGFRNPSTAAVACPPAIVADPLAQGVRGLLRTLSAHHLRDAHDARVGVYLLVARRGLPAVRGARREAAAQGQSRARMTSRAASALLGQVACRHSVSLESRGCEQK